MTDLVKCDRCGTPFSIQTAGIRSTWSGDYMVQYFTCPGCHHRYQILTTDTELRQTIQRHKAIAAKIKLGQTKHFRPGTHSAKPCSFYMHILCLVPFHLFQQ